MKNRVTGWHHTSPWLRLGQVMHHWLVGATKSPLKNDGVRQLGWFVPIPIGSMYGIYANIGGILMVNVTIYSIHGSYGIWKNKTCSKPPTIKVWWKPSKCVPSVPSELVMKVAITWPYTSWQWDNNSTKRPQKYLIHLPNFPHLQLIFILWLYPSNQGYSAISPKAIVYA
jgi:hypothetical protein